ncbi:MAG: energy-coupling factor ABC transporter substrate-binding protein [Anaerovorax sp.]
MSKNAKIVMVCLALCVVIATLPLIFIDSEFGGADGAAEETIGEMDPNYVPWIEPVFQLPGGETESLLFCLQAALGSGVFFFGMGYLVARKKYKHEE